MFELFYVVGVFFFFYFLEMMFLLLRCQRNVFSLIFVSVVVRLDFGEAGNYTGMFCVILKGRCVASTLWLDWILEKLEITQGCFA